MSTETGIDVLAIVIVLVVIVGVVMANAISTLMLFNQQRVSELKELRARVERMETRHSELLIAFDKWFDLVAGELGFEAQATWPTYAYYGGGSSVKLAPVSPRIAEDVVVPEQRTPKRTPAKICAKRARRKDK